MPVQGYQKQMRKDPFTPNIKALGEAEFYHTGCI